MRRKKLCAGSAVPAVLLALLLLILVVATTYIFLAGIWPMPPSITKVGDLIDRQYNLTLIITGVIFILAQLALGYLVWRYRDHGQRVRFTRGSHTLEILWTTATFVLFISLGALAIHAWAQVHFLAPAPGAMRIEVVAEQFTWNFHYSGPDSHFARTAPQFYNDSSGNPAGIDPSDSDKDDFVSPILVVPVNHEVELLLTTKDVIHSFFVRELRIKQDIVPGMVIPIHFTPRAIGTYEIVCAQLCGLGHYRMRSFLKVVSEAEYEAWVREQESSQ
jgi:cytochrome c oxidase subunit II